MSNIKFGVVGAGATGGYLAAALASAGNPVTMLARGESAGVIARDGVTVHGPDGEIRTVRMSRVVQAGESVDDPVDVALFCVKSGATARAAEAVRPLVGDTGRILCLQNGVNNEDVLAEAFGADRILSGVLYIGAERVAPGVIKSSTHARTTIGPYRGEATRPLWQPTRDAFVAAGVSCVIDENIRGAKWQKFLFNCGLNPLTAVVREKLGTIRATESGRALFDALVDEAIVAARAAGAPLAADARERVDDTADRMDISSSMAEDLSAGRPMEIDAFTGYVLELAQNHGVDTPTTRVIDGLLRVLNGKATSRADLSTSVQTV